MSSKLLSRIEIFCFFLLLLLIGASQSCYSQTYINRLYDYNAPIPEGASSGHLELVGDTLVSVGARNNEDQNLVLVASKFDLSGNTLMEKQFVLGSNFFNTAGAEKFQKWGSKYYLVGKGMNNASAGIYCFDLNLDTVWTRNFDFLNDIEIGSPERLFLDQDYIYVVCLFYPEIGGQQPLVGRWDYEGNFIDVVVEPTSNFTGSSNHGFVISDIFVENEHVYISGRESLGWIQDMNGSIGLAVEGEEVFSAQQGHPDHIDTPIRIEPFDEDYLLGVQMITDSVYTSGLTVNEGYWYNQLYSFKIDKSSLEISDLESHGNYWFGHLYDFEYQGGFKVISGEVDGIEGNYTNGLIHNFGENPYSTQLNYLTCSPLCRNRIFDIELDEYGNVYGIGTVVLDTLDYLGNFSWIVSIDCHGRKSAPNFENEIMVSILEDGSTLLTSSNPVFDDYVWYVDDQVLHGSAHTLELELGTYEVTLETHYCGKTFELVEEIEVTTSITEASDPRILIYPNPGNGVFTLDSNLEISKIVCYNALGQTIDVKSQQLSGGKTSTYISSGRGIYFLHVHEGNEKRYLRMLVVE